MTLIEITPLQAAMFSRARVTSKPVHGTFEDVQAWTFDQFTPPFIALAPPAINDAWIITLIIGASTITRTVTFSGTVAKWNDLIDVDPTTLDPVPEDSALAAWITVRNEILSAIELPDLINIFENRIF